MVAGRKVDPTNEQFKSRAISELGSSGKWMTPEEIIQAVDMPTYEPTQAYWRLRELVVEGKLIQERRLRDGRPTGPMHYRLNSDPNTPQKLPVIKRPGRARAALERQRAKLQEEINERNSRLQAREESRPAPVEGHEAQVSQDATQRAGSVLLHGEVQPQQPESATAPSTPEKAPWTGPYQGSEVPLPRNGDAAREASPQASPADTTHDAPAFVPGQDNPLSPRDAGRAPQKWGADGQPAQQNAVSIGLELVINLPGRDLVRLPMKQAYAMFLELKNVFQQ